MEAVHKPHAHQHCTIHLCPLHSNNNSYYAFQHRLGVRNSLLCLPGWCVLRVEVRPSNVAGWGARQQKSVPQVPVAANNTSTF